MQNAAGCRESLRASFPVAVSAEGEIDKSYTFRAGHAFTQPQVLDGGTEIANGTQGSYRQILVTA